MWILDFFFSSAKQSTEQLGCFCGRGTEISAQNLPRGRSITSFTQAAVGFCLFTTSTHAVQHLMFSGQGAGGDEGRQSMPGKPQDETFVKHCSGSAP